MGARLRSQVQARFGQVEATSFPDSMITTMTGKNQITIPAEIVLKAGLRPGTRLDWRPTERKNVLEVRTLPDAVSVAEALRGRGKAKRRKGGSVVARLVSEREGEDRGWGTR
jgi:bifunctional DNA-binding transcriptional regulator/antitoxin component of YhaV-PrlF toxin-antitoxin module